MTSDALAHLRNAREELLRAKEKTNLGSSLMIGSIVDDLERLISRFESINEDKIEEDNE